MRGNAAEHDQGRAAVVWIGEALSSRTTAAHAVTTTDDHRDLVMTADGETATTAMTDAGVALEMATLAVASLEYHAVPSDEMTATVKPLAPDPATPAGGAITHVQEVPRPSIATYHAANGATTATATASAQIVVTAKEMTAETANGMIVGAPAMPAVNVRAAFVPESTTAGTHETAARVRVGTLGTQSEGAGSRTLTAMCLAVVATRIVKMTESGMIRSELGREAGAEAEIEREIESGTGTVTGTEMIATETTAAVRTTATETPDGVAVDRGVGTVVAEDVDSIALQMHLYSVGQSLYHYFPAFLR